MQRPVLSNVSNNREMISTFLGYNHRVVQQAGEFFNTENITLDDYPMLSNRAPMNRYKYPLFDNSFLCDLYDGPETSDSQRAKNRIGIFNDRYVHREFTYHGDNDDGSAVMYSARGVHREFNMRIYVDFKSKLTEKVRVKICDGKTINSECFGLEFMRRYVAPYYYKWPIKSISINKQMNDEIINTFQGPNYIYDLDSSENVYLDIAFVGEEIHEVAEQPKFGTDNIKKQYQRMEDKLEEDLKPVIDGIKSADASCVLYIDKAASGDNVGCMIKNGLMTSVFNDVLYYQGNHYSLRGNIPDLAAVNGKLQLLNFGTKILIFPYGLYFDTEEPDKGVLPLAFNKTTDTYFGCDMCSADGAPYTRLIYSAAKPAGAAVGTYVVRSSGDLMAVRGNGEFNTVAAASAWKRQDKDPGTKGNDYWLDTTGTTGSGLKKFSQGTLYKNEDGAWVAVDNVLFSNTWFYAYWVDTTNDDAPVFKAYSATADDWIAVPVTYVLVDTTDIKDDILASVKAGDTVKFSVSAGKSVFVTEWANVHSVADDGSRLIVKGLRRAIDSTYHCPNRIEKVLPEFDFVTVAQNRVWGCKYGKDSAGKHINQIYASKLGDPTNWYCFENTASDSYALSLGDDEPFTGAVSLNDMPYFFKQNKIYGIYGGYPAAYQRIAIEDRGVENDCSGSLAVLNGAVFYKSLDGVCVFDGSTVTNISAALGNTRYTEANAGSSLGKYYISMKNETDGGYETFVYDLNTSLWVRLNGMRYLHFITDYTGSVYAMDPNCIFHELGRHNETALSGLELYKTEDKVEWYAETGAIDFSYPDKKIVSRINLRAKIALGAVLKAFIQYDSSGQWIQMGVLTGNGTPKTEVLNIVPQACDHYALRLEGCGDVRVISIANTMTLGSDL